MAVALGSNLGDREAAFRFAVAGVAEFISNLRISNAIETDPEGEEQQDQPRYLNAVLVGETSLAARDLLDRLLAIEQACGRQRPYPNAPRTLDLDLILLGDMVENTADLQVPHPRFRERLFVLAPLAEIAADMVDPVTEITVGELLKKVEMNRGPGDGKSACGPREATE